MVILIIFFLAILMNDIRAIRWVGLIENYTVNMWRLIMQRLNIIISSLCVACFTGVGVAADLPKLGV